MRTYEEVRDNLISIIATTAGLDDLLTDDISDLEEYLAEIEKIQMNIDILKKNFSEDIID